MRKILVLSTSFSGISRYLLKFLCKKGWELIVIDVPPLRISKYLAIISTFSLKPGDWRKKAGELRGENLIKALLLF